jgi:hypothetical protein
MQRLRRQAGLFACLVLPSVLFLVSSTGGFLAVDPRHTYEQDGRRAYPTGMQRGAWLEWLALTAADCLFASHFCLWDDSQ